MHFPGDEFRTGVLYPMEFNAVRVHNSTLYSTTFEIKIALTPSHADTREPHVIEEKSEEGMQRLNFWKETILDNILLVDINSDIFIDLASSADNTIMFCPGPPTDHMLIELLHAKVSAITKGLFDIHGLSISSSDTHYIETSFRKLDEYNLPDISYFPEVAIHPRPWWERDTIEVCEFPKGSILENDLFNHFSDFFGEKEADIIIFRTDGKDEDGPV